jgi:monoterpene epsilon-lactone hydrolase
MPSAAYPVFRLLTRLAARLILPAASAADLRRLRRWMALGRGWAPLARGVRARPVAAGGVPAEWLTPAQARPGAALLYLHGGGWTLGQDSAHRMLISHLARAAGLPVLALDYRLAPEHPFPAALDDCQQAFAWLHAQGYPPNHIGLAGDSAGANLALALALQLQASGQPLPGAIASLSGMFDLEGTGASFHTARDVMLTPAFALAMAAHYAAGRDRRDPLLSPLWSDLAGFPPLLIQAGAEEMLLSDAERLAERARAAGVAVTLSIYPRLWHAWHVWAPALPEAAQAVREAGQFLRTTLEVEA